MILPALVFALRVGDVDVRGVLEVVLVHPHGRVEQQVTILKFLNFFTPNPHETYQSVRGCQDDLICTNFFNGILNKA